MSDNEKNTNSTQNVPLLNRDNIHKQRDIIDTNDTFYTPFENDLFINKKINPQTEVKPKNNKKTDDVIIVQFSFNQKTFKHNYNCNSLIQELLINIINELKHSLTNNNFPTLIVNALNWNNQLVNIHRFFDQFYISKPETLNADFKMFNIKNLENKKMCDLFTQKMVELTIVEKKTKKDKITIVFYNKQDDKLGEQTFKLNEFIMTIVNFIKDELKIEITKYTLSSKNSFDKINNDLAQLNINKLDLRLVKEFFQTDVRLILQPIVQPQPIVESDCLMKNSLGMPFSR